MTIEDNMQLKKEKKKKERICMITSKTIQMPKHSVGFSLKQKSQHAVYIAIKIEKKCTCVE